MKKIFTMIAIGAIIGIVLYSCEKSDTYNVSQNNIKQRIQKEGENTRLYQLQWCYTEDGVNGYSCTGPVAVVATLQCSTPHGCVPFSSPQDQPPTTITDEQAKAMYVQILEDYGCFPHRRDFILQYWGLYQYFYEKGEIMQSPEELYLSAEE